MSINNLDYYLKENNGNCVVLFSSSRCLPCIEIKKYIEFKNINIKCLIREDNNKELFKNNNIKMLPQIREYNSYNKEIEIIGFEKIMKYLKNDYIEDDFDNNDF